MSLSNQIEVPCPKCHVPQLFEEWVVVDVTSEPEMKTRVLDGDLFILKCILCGEQSHIQKPLLYSDTGKGFMVHLLHGEEPERDTEEMPPALQNVKLRYVDTEMQFYEKICIFDDRLDDRIIEIEKLALIDLVRKEWQNDPIDVIYQGLSKYAQGGKQMGYFVVLEEGVRNLTFPFPAKYKQSVRQCMPGLPDPATEMGVWLKVDSEYAKARLASLDQNRRRPRSSASGITPASGRSRPRASASGIKPASRQRRRRASASNITPASRQKRRRRFKR